MHMYRHFCPFVAHVCFWHFLQVTINFPWDGGTSAFYPNEKKGRMVGCFLPRKPGPALKEDALRKAKKKRRARSKTRKRGSGVFAPSCAAELVRRSLSDADGRLLTSFFLFWMAEKGSETPCFEQLIWWFSSARTFPTKSSFADCKDAGSRSCRAAETLQLGLMLLCSCCFSCWLFFLFHRLVCGSFSRLTKQAMIKQQAKTRTWCKVRVL